MRVEREIRDDANLNGLAGAEDHGRSLDGELGVVGSGVAGEAEEGRGQEQERAGRRVQT